MDLRALCRVVSWLPVRERRVLVGRYGLDGAPPRTLAALATELGVTRERVRQIQVRAEERCAAALRPSSA